MKKQCTKEEERVNAVYAKRDLSGISSLYAWHRPEVREQDAERERIYASFLFEAFGANLSKITALDVGCGDGRFLQMLVSWGANPELLIGTEYLETRLKAAVMRTAPGISWHLGDLDFVQDATCDLVVANTVFSSILQEDIRNGLAGEMWRVLKPGGHIMVFDFRYNNPLNKNVRRVTRRELSRYWHQMVPLKYQTLLLLPPLARLLAPYSLTALRILGCIPVFRSHFVYMVKKPN